MQDKVSIFFEDDQKQIEVAPDQSLTEICDEYPTAILFGCRNAVCGTCLIEVTQGMGNISAVESDEQDLLSVLAPDNASARLACQCIIHKGEVQIRALKS